MFLKMLSIWHDLAAVFSMTGSSVNVNRRPIVTLLCVVAVYQRQYSEHTISNNNNQFSAKFLYLAFVLNFRQKLGNDQLCLFDYKRDRMQGILTEIYLTRQSRLFSEIFISY